MDDTQKVQVIFPKGEARYRKVKVMFDGKQLPVHSFELKPGGEIGYELILKIRTANFEVLHEE